MAKCLCPIVPTIFLAPLAAWKIENLTMMSPDEVSALGVVRDVYEDDQLTEIVVEDIRVPRGLRPSSQSSRPTALTPPTCGCGCTRTRR
jgi:hypothetical protein